MIPSKTVWYLGVSTFCTGKCRWENSLYRQMLICWLHRNSTKSHLNICKKLVFWRTMFDCFAKFNRVTSVVPASKVNWMWYCMLTGATVNEGIRFEWEIVVFLGVWCREFQSTLPVIRSWTRNPRKSRAAACAYVINVTPLILRRFGSGGG